MADDPSTPVPSPHDVDVGQTRVIELNVGGHHLTTTDSTLQESPFFQSLLSGKFKVRNLRKEKIISFFVLKPLNSVRDV
jgi:hypothetical protein